MATWVTYSCNQCDYSAVISGGPDALFMGYTETMLCNDCMELSDYIVETPEGVKTVVFTCEECDTHNVTKWDYKTKPCPQCAKGKMIKGKEGITTTINAD
jgi:hypothetical protein